MKTLAATWLVMVMLPILSYRAMNDKQQLTKEARAEEEYIRAIANRTLNYYSAEHPTMSSMPMARATSA